MLSRMSDVKNILDILDSNAALCKVIDEFMTHIKDDLYRDVKSELDNGLDVRIPDVDAYLDDILAGNRIFMSFKKEGFTNLSKSATHEFIQNLFSGASAPGLDHNMFDYYEQWLITRLVKQIVADEKFCDINVLMNLVDREEMIQGLYPALLDYIPNSWVSKLQVGLTQIDTKVERMLDYSIYQHEYTSIDVIKILYSPESGMTHWNFVDSISRCSEYVELASDYRFKSALIARHNLKIWFEFWRRMQYPVIQDRMLNIYVMRDPGNYASLLNITMTENIPSDEKTILGFIIAKNWFFNMRRISERLAIYGDDSRQTQWNKDVFESGKKIAAEWQKEKNGLFLNFISLLLNIIPINEVEDWIFSYQPRYDRYSAIFNTEVKSLVKTFNEITKEIYPDDFSTLNIRKFNVYAEKFENHDDKAKCSQLLEAVINYISSKEFRWDGNINNDVEEAFNHIANLVLREDSPEERVKRLLDDFCVRYQGWNSHFPKYEVILRESFIFDSIPYMLIQSEFKEKIEDKDRFFTSYLNVVLRQLRFCVGSSEQYILTLSIAYWISSNVSETSKEYCQSAVINSVDDITFVIKALLLDGVYLSKKAKESLSKRIEVELPLIDNILSNTNRKQELDKLHKMASALMDGHG